MGTTTEIEQDAGLPSLPSWSSPPEDVAAATREIKAAIAERISASGRSIEHVWGALADRIGPRIEEVREATAQRGSAWPIVEFDDIANATLSPSTRDEVRARGCVVVRNHFPRERAQAWDQELVDYLDDNDFMEVYRGPGDDFFATVDSKPEIYPIYWSRPQMEARQDDRMRAVQRFLNGLWNSHDGEVFDPSISVQYPDRVRRRPPGTTSGGLGAHIDAGTIDLWMKPEYQAAFRHLFAGQIEQFDPWDARYRTIGSQYEGTTMTSVFRTFQGWTALSDMEHDQGVLFSIPIPEAISALLLRPLLADVADEDLCGVTQSRTFPVTDEWHAELLGATSTIPDVRAGDSVWWHGDMVHGVASVTEQEGWGNVMYIPAAPWCERNERYARSVYEAFLRGDSPSDFPDEHYEVGWRDRFQPHDLNDFGLAGFGQSPAD